MNEERKFGLLVLQLLFHRKLTKASDVFSFGVVLIEIASHSVVRVDRDVKHICDILRCVIQALNPQQTSIFFFWCDHMCVCSLLDQVSFTMFSTYRPCQATLLFCRI